jgi:hypothetical protein
VCYILRKYRKMISMTVVASAICSKVAHKKVFFFCTKPASRNVPRLKRASVTIYIYIYIYMCVCVYSDRRKRRIEVINGETNDDDDDGENKDRSRRNIPESADVEENRTQEKLAQKKSATKESGGREKSRVWKTKRQRSVKETGGRLSSIEDGDKKNSRRGDGNKNGDDDGSSVVNQDEVEADYLRQVEEVTRGLSERKKKMDRKHVAFSSSTMSLASLGNATPPRSSIVPSSSSHSTSSSPRSDVQHPLDQPRESTSPADRQSIEDLLRLVQKLTEKLVPLLLFSEYRSMRPCDPITLFCE